MGKAIQEADEDLFGDAMVGENLPQLHS